MAEWKNPRTHPHVCTKSNDPPGQYILHSTHGARAAPPTSATPATSTYDFGLLDSHLVPGDFQILPAEINLLLRQCGTRRRLTRRGVTGVDSVVETMQAPSCVVLVTANRGSDLRGSLDEMRFKGARR